MNLMICSVSISKLFYKCNTLHAGYTVCSDCGYPNTCPIPTVDTSMHYALKKITG